jgi:hypothetical protein
MHYYINITAMHSNAQSIIPGLCGHLTLVPECTVIGAWIIWSSDTCA